LNNPVGIQPITMKNTLRPLGSALTLMIAFSLAPPGQGQVEEKDSDRKNKLLPIPDKLVVLSFDDGNVSDFTTTAPILKKHGFGATFYVSPGWVGLAGRLSWKQVKELDAQGFEIGNHSASHPNMLHITEEQVREEIAAVDRACKEHGVRKPTTFAYPGEHHDRRIVKALAEAGYVAARRGVTPEYSMYDRGGPGSAYNPREEDPFLIPGAFVRGNLSPSEEAFEKAIGKAKNGSVCVLIYHGVPDVHPHCSTSLELFTRDMQYLKDEGCTVIAMRDLAKYVDLSNRPKDIYAPIIARLGITAIALKCDTSRRKPRFSWKIGTTRPQTQAAYQILVASSEKILAAGKGDLWDSGKVASNMSTGVAYAGKALPAGRKFWWKVRSWNEPDKAEVKRQNYWIALELLEEMVKSRAGPFSAPASFEIAKKIVTDIPFISSVDRTEQKYVQVLPEGFREDHLYDVLIGLRQMQWLGDGSR